MVGVTINATWRGTFRARSSVSRIKRSRTVQTPGERSRRNLKTISRSCRKFKFQQSLKRIFSTAAWNQQPHAITCRTNRGDWKKETRTASCSNASLPRVQESRWQLQTGADQRSVRPRKQETSSRQARGQDTKKKKKKKKTIVQRKPERAALQRQSPGGQHLAYFDTLPSAFVKVSRALWHGQHAIVFTIEKVQTRGTNSDGLDCLVQKLARTWWQWCHTSTFDSQWTGKASQEDRLHVFGIPTGDTFKKAFLEGGWMSAATRLIWGTH